MFIINEKKCLYIHEQLKASFFTSKGENEELNDVSVMQSC